MALEDATEPGGPTSVAGAPDWRTQKDEILCPMCEYNLCGLAEPRCPECGYRFAWAELLDARVRPHRYLFEHHPEANFKSFWKTAWGGLRIVRFWQELNPAMISRPRRLLAYWIMSMLLGWAGWLAYAVPLGISLAKEANQARAWFTQRYSPVSTDPRALQLELDKHYPLPPSIEFFDWLWKTEPNLRCAARLLLLYMSWPWLTLGTLMIFRFSMRRAKVRAIHVVRCVLYSHDFMTWVGVAVVGIIVARGVSVGLEPPGAWYSAPYGIGSPLLVGYDQVTLGPGRGLTRFYLAQVLHASPPFILYTHAIAGGMVLWAAVRLCLAYRYYLRFDWPAATVFASQFILLLCLMIFVLNVPCEFSREVEHLFELGDGWR